MRPWKGKGPQRLLASGYIGKNARSSINLDAAREEDSSPEWMAELTPVQRAVMRGQDSCPVSPPSLVKSDGETCWTEESPEVYQPSIYIHDPDSTIDEKEFYFWDLCGHLVIRNVMEAA